MPLKQPSTGTYSGRRLFACMAERLLGYNRLFFKAHDACVAFINACLTYAATVYRIQHDGVYAPGHAWMVLHIIAHQQDVHPGVDRKHQRVFQAVMPGNGPHLQVIRNYHTLPAQGAAQGHVSAQRIAKRAGCCPACCGTGAPPSPCRACPFGATPCRAQAPGLARCG